MTITKIAQKVGLSYAALLHNYPELHTMVRLAVREQKAQIKALQKEKWRVQIDEAAIRLIDQGKKLWQGNLESDWHQRAICSIQTGDPKTAPPADRRIRFHRLKSTFSAVTLDSVPFQSYVGTDSGEELGLLAPPLLRCKAAVTFREILDRSISRQWASLSSVCFDVALFYSPL